MYIYLFLCTFFAGHFQVLFCIDIASSLSDYGKVRPIQSTQGVPSTSSSSTVLNCGLVHAVMFYSLLVPTDTGRVPRSGPASWDT